MTLQINAEFVAKQTGAAADVKASVPDLGRARPSGAPEINAPQGPGRRWTALIGMPLTGKIFS